MKIVNFGSCNVDYVYRVDHMVRPGETLSAPQMDIFPGGKGLNQTVAAARAGGEVYHAGYVGSDGAICEEILAACGADLRYLHRSDAKNGHAIIQLDNRGENSIVIYPGTNVLLTREDIDRVLADFDPGDLVMTTNEVSFVPEILQKAHARGLRVLFNPAPYDESLREIPLGSVDYLILNETESVGLFDSCDPEALRRILHETYPELTVLLTLGSKGCALIRKEEILVCPAFAVQAVDTTAAGDTFTGYFAALLGEDMDMAQRLRLCCAASALAVSQAGAAPSIPQKEQTLDALEWLREK